MEIKDHYIFKKPPDYGKLLFFLDLSGNALICQQRSSRARVIAEKQRRASCWSKGSAGQSSSHLFLNDMEEKFVKSQRCEIPQKNVKYVEIESSDSGLAESYQPTQANFAKLFYKVRELGVDDSFSSDLSEQNCEKLREKPKIQLTENRDVSDNGDITSFSELWTESEQNDEISDASTVEYQAENVISKEIVRNFSCHSEVIKDIPDFQDESDCVILETGCRRKVPIIHRIKKPKKVKFDEDNLLETQTSTPKKKKKKPSLFHEFYSVDKSTSEVIAKPKKIFKKRRKVPKPREDCKTEIDEDSITVYKPPKLAESEYILDAKSSYGTIQRSENYDQDSVIWGLVETNNETGIKEDRTHLLETLKYVICFLSLVLIGVLIAKYGFISTEVPEDQTGYNNLLFYIVLSIIVVFLSGILALCHYRMELKSLQRGEQI